MKDFLLSMVCVATLLFSLTSTAMTDNSNTHGYHDTCLESQSGFSKVILDSSSHDVSLIRCMYNNNDSSVRVAPSSYSVKPLSGPWQNLRAGVYSCASNQAKDCEFKVTKG